MPAKVMSMDEFLEHQGSSSGSGTVLKWRDDGQIDVLLHPKAPFVSLWSSSWFAIVKDRETGNDKLIFTRFNSYEDEDAVLKKQRFRGDDGEFHVKYPWHDKSVTYYGARQHPPVICPMSLLIEWVREHIEGEHVPDDQVIGWLDRIFDVDVPKGGDENAAVVHAGGFCNLLRDDDMDDKEKAEVRRAGIRLNEAFREDAKPRMQYVGCVVPYKKPSEGAAVFIEAEALGKAFKKHILDLRDDKRDPRQHPVVFRWKYDEKESFSRKYDVSVRHSDPITDDHLKVLAADYPKEKLERIIADSNLVELRQSFERWWCHKVVPPWDLIFQPAMTAYAGKPQASAPEDFDAKQFEGKAEPGPDRSLVQASGPAPTIVGKEELVAKPPLVDGSANVGEEEYECEHCKGAMRGTDLTCSHCGATYDPVTGAMTPPLPKEVAKPAGRRTRGSATKS